MLVTTIKLGTKSCGFAHQFKGIFEEDPQCVDSFMFDSGTRLNLSLDFPPALILTGDGHAEEFGYRAIKKFEEGEEIKDYNKDYVFFENVIENLYFSEVCCVVFQI